MTRNRRSAKTAGTRFETAVRDYLALALDDVRIMRPRLSGGHDVGDIANIFFMGQRVCIECKNTSRKDYRRHMREAMVEAGNLDAPFYWVVQKVPGIGLSGTDSVGRQLAYTTLSTLGLMRHEAPDDLFLSNTGNFKPLANTGFVCCDLRAFALILNHGFALGKEMTPDADQ